MNNCYNFTLADGRRWLIQAEDTIVPWLNDFAKIMSLTPGNLSSDNLLYFFSSSNDTSKGYSNKTIKLLSQGHWTQYFDGTPIYLWVNQQTCENIIEINTSFLHIRDMYYLNMCFSLSFLFFYSLQNGGIPIHAASAVYKGKGILIAATGDTGKTTCCRRLPKDKWNSYCDDLSLLIYNRKRNLSIHPLPTWSDYMAREMNTTWKLEQSAPLKALFFLEQSSIDQIVPLSTLETSIRLIKSVKQASFWNMNNEPVSLRKSYNTKILNNTQQIAKELPGYLLKATLDGEFWKYIEEVI